MVADLMLYPLAEGVVACSELATLRLHLLEQTRVLDRDDCLVREL